MHSPSATEFAIFLIYLYKESNNKILVFITVIFMLLNDLFLAFTISKVSIVSKHCIYIDYLWYFILFKFIHFKA